MVMVILKAMVLVLKIDPNNLKIPVKATNSKVGTSLIRQCVVVDHV